MRLDGDRLLQGDRVRRVVRHQLGYAVDLAVRHAEHPADIAQHGTRLQCAEGDDLSDPVAAVFLLDVADHLVAPVLAEIDVEIRHRHALGVEKPLEQQAKALRVEIGDGQGPGDDRPGPRPAPGTDRDALAFGPLDDVRDDQEIAGKAHPDDRAELEFEALAVRACGGGINSGAGEPLLEAGPRRAAQRGFLVDPVGRREGRQDRLTRLRDEGTAAGDDKGIVAGFRQIGEEGPHLFGRSKVMMRGQPLAFLVGDNGRLGDAKQRVVRLVKITIGKVGVVGRDEREIVTISQLDEARLGPRFFGRLMAHQLDVEPIGKHAGEVDQGTFGSFGLALREQPPDGTARPSGQTEEPIARSS